MTVPANLNRVDYTGTGSAGPFTVPFPFYDASHLTVLQTDALFNQTTLTGWTATGAGGPSGAVTLAAACPVGSTLTIMRIVPLTQITSIKNQEAFFPEVHEQEMDLLAMADQQLDEAMDRTLRLPAGLSGVDMTLPKPDPGHALVWNAAGDGLENAGAASATLQQDLADSADVAKGDEMIAVKQPFTGAVARTQHDKNTDSQNVNDYASIQHAVTASAGLPLVFQGVCGINADLIGLGSVGKVINQGATFSNYTVKECFPDYLFDKANSKLKSFFKNRSNLLYPKVVITGDSLSYNHQDFDATARAEANDCYPGMNSWAFGLRDALIREDDFFKHGDEIPYLLGTGPSALYGNGQAQFFSPFNGRIQCFRATAQTQEIKLAFKHFGPENKIYLWLLKNPTNTGCSFRVDVGVATQVPLWNTGGTNASDPYQGCELHFLEVPNVPNNGLWQSITLTDFVGTATVPHATNREVFLCGISTSFVKVSLTGKGSQSSKWLADNLAERVTNYAPDLTIITIGANDPWSGNPQGLQTVQEYQTNLNTIIEGIRSANPRAQILLISPPLTSESIIPNATMQRYINKARETAYLKECAFIDTADLFSSVPTTVYRFDSIHFSKKGNEILLRKIVDLLGLKCSYPGMLDPSFSVGDYVYKYPEIPFSRFYANWNGSSFVLTKLSKPEPYFTPIINVEKLNNYTLKVRTSISTALLSYISIHQFDANGLEKITASPQNYFDGYVLFQLRKQDGSQLTEDDWTTYATSLKFIVECS
jgi:hypothetical protein